MTDLALGPDMAASRPLSIARWLLGVAALVFCMVVVGGITRLTESGLSITEWKPITGAIPPLTHAQWEDAFRLYQQIPEYQQLRQGMTLSDFQFIFFWEWVHRLLGRLIGLAFALPLLWFAWRRAIPSGYGWRLVALLALGGLQGAIGWWMVTSGLSVRTDVSHYRLAVHLLTALFIIGGLVWTALDLLALARNPAARPAALRPFALVVLLALLILTATTVGLAFLELPPAVHVALAMTIAAIKAALVAAVFMHLLREAPATRLVALMAAILLAIFMLMVTVDIRHLGGG